MTLALVLCLRSPHGPLVYGGHSGVFAAKRPASLISSTFREGGPVPCLLLPEIVLIQSCTNIAGVVDSTGSW